MASTYESTDARTQKSAIIWRKYLLYAKNYKHSDGGKLQNISVVEICIGGYYAQQLVVTRTIINL
jgi:hypothetical protein